MPYICIENHLGAIEWSNSVSSENNGPKGAAQDGVNRGPARAGAGPNQQRKAAAQKPGSDIGSLMSQMKRAARETAGAVARRKMPSRAHLRARHLGVIASFFLLCVAPVVISSFYLYAMAADRYVSLVGFSVRKEESGSAVELLGGIAEFSGSSSADTDIIYKFIQSQELVARLDAKLGLRQLWAKGNPNIDFIYAYDPPGTIEDLVEYWQRMVKVYNNSGTGLIDLEVQAFTPEDAQRIAQAIYDESAALVNELSAIAREDSISYARDELTDAVRRLKQARAALTRFRNETQIVDPSASIQSQMGLLSSLQMQLASTLIDLDTLRQTTRANDPRVVQVELRVEVIRKQIQAERDKLGLDGPVDGLGGDGQVFAELVGRYEELAVDQDFAEQAYVAALTAYDAASAEARRKTRYLAAHVHPTRAETSTKPDRPMTIGLIALFSFLFWGMAVLTYYALKDRR